MKRRKGIYILLAFIILISIACNLTELLGDDPETGESTTQNEIESLHITQTALVLEITEQAIGQLPDTIEVPEEIPTDIPEIITEEIEEIIHDLVPGDSGEALGEIFDTSSGETGEMGYTIDGDNYKDGIMLERPFMPDMAYRPDIDIIRAEINSDGQFIMVTIYVEAVNLQTDNLNANYGVEIDIDFDGRGDFLIWASNPMSTEWITDTVMVLEDSNDDIGGETPIGSDAPMTTSTDGFESIVFSTDTNDDPDGAYCRLHPDIPTAVQISFKMTLIGQDRFLWSAWADDGIKITQAIYNYNDQFTFEKAGSPIDGHPNYPLKELFAVDNTCRMGYNEKIIDAQIGTCGTTTEDITPAATSAPTVLPTFLPDIIPTGFPDLTP